MAKRTVDDFYSAIQEGARQATLEAIEGIFGEVQESPSQYTVLDRLKTIGTLLGVLDASAVTDPADAASVIAALKGLLTDVGQISDSAVAAGAAGSIAAKLRRLTTDLADVQGKIGAADSAIVDAGAAGNVSAKLRRVTKDLGDLVALIDSGALKVKFPSAQEVTLSGSNVDLRGLADDRPAAGDVDPGTTYWSVDNGDVSVSDGSTWRSLGVA